MTDLYAWAAQWQIPVAAIHDLKFKFGLTGAAAIEPNDVLPFVNEATVQAKVRLEAGRKGVLLWRNNVGALQDKQDRWVRYGLANDSAAVNERIKSADLIGIRPVQIGGRIIGQFISREVKPPSWKFTGTESETAQLRWLELIQAAGGDAAFVTGEGSL